MTGSLVGERKQQQQSSRDKRSGQELIKGWRIERRGEADPDAARGVADGRVGRVNEGEMEGESERSELLVVSIPSCLILLSAVCGRRLVLCLLV